MMHEGGEALSYLCPPESLGAVEAGVYRCSAIAASSFPFVRQLRLRTALYLSPEAPIRAVSHFFQDCNTRFIHLGLKAWKPYATWKPISEELIKEALELVLDVNTHPIMVMCASGIQQTGTLVGCLRRLQKWNLTSVIEEYRRYAGSKARYVNEQFIELFDEDLVTLPRDLPMWFINQRRMMEEEEREYEELQAMAAAAAERSIKESLQAGKEEGKRETVPSDGETVTETHRDGAALTLARVQLGAEKGVPGYRQFYYSRSSPLTTENRSYKRKIIGKVVDEEGDADRDGASPCEC